MEEIILSKVELIIVTSNKAHPHREREQETKTTNIAMDSTNQKAKTVKRVVSRLLKAITKETKS